MFVSHNMGVIQSLCPRAILLRNGRVVSDGPSAAVVGEYLEPESRMGADGVARRNPGEGEWFRAAWLETEAGVAAGVISCRETFRVCCELAAPRVAGPVELSLRVSTRTGQPVFTSLYSQSEGRPLARLDAAGVFSAEIPGGLLMPGAYLADLALHEPVGPVYDRWHGALAFEIAEDGSAFARYGGYHEIGVVMPVLKWSTKRM